MATGSAGQRRGELLTNLGRVGVDFGYVEKTFRARFFSDSVINVAIKKQTFKFA